MPSNCGQTSLKRRRSKEGAMQAFDKLPLELRLWVADAALPWRPSSVLKSYRRALQRTGDPAQALHDLDALEARLLAKDAGRVWGSEYPLAA